MPVTFFVFSIFDSKLESFTSPIFVPSRAAALRSFMAAANDPSHDFYKFSEDYTLFELGFWREDDGSFVLLATPKSVALAATVKKERV